MTDHEARLRATTELHVSLALSAGAGSGKTTVLSTRIAELLAKGTDPSRVAAITFTEKAAGELESRVRDSLEQQLVSAAGERRAALESALARFHELTLSTIHSFCRRLLAAEALAAAFAPGTDVGVSEPSGLARGLRAWREHLSAHAPLTHHLTELLSPGALEQAVDSLLANRDLEPHLAAEGVDWAEAATGLADVLAEIEGARAQCRRQTDVLYQSSTPFVETLRAWVAAGDEGAVEALASAEEAKKTGGTQANWPGGTDAYKRTLDRIAGWREKHGARAHRDLVLSLREHVTARVLEGRRLAAVASFDDLLFRAAALLGDARVRARLAGRFDALFVDEVQDTDPVQAEVALLLTRERDRDGAWTAWPPRPGSLFAVGDPKQSIYRFRRADVEVWRELAQVVARDGRTDSLVRNFRSVPGVVAWVNHTFGSMNGFEAQEAVRAPAELDPVVCLVPAPNAEQKVPIEHEAEAVVRHLAELRARGQRVVDRDTKELRPLAHRDVMLLVPRWTHAQALAHELARFGVEAVVEGGGGFFRDEAVVACHATLRALDEPSDTASTVICLRRLFGLTLEDLARHHQAGGALRWTVRDGRSGPVADALAVVREASRHQSASLVRALDAVLDATRAPAVWSMLAHGAAHLANVDKLRALVRELEAEGLGSSGVLDRLAELENGGDENDLLRLDTDSDAVRITSVFKAKGLEAPLVVLLDGSRDLRAPDAIPVRASAGDQPGDAERVGRLHLKLTGALAPPDWERTVELEKEALEAERTRWMYVAATRARDQLVVVTHEAAKLFAEHCGDGLVGPGTHDELVSLGEASGAPVTVRRRVAADLPAVPAQSELFPGRDPSVAERLAAPAGLGDAAGEARAKELARVVAEAKRACARWKSVGELAHRRPVSSGTGVGAAGGVVIHRAMERLDLTRPTAELRTESHALVRALASEAGLSDELASRCDTILQRLLAHPILEEVRAAPEHWKETPFTYRRKGVLVSGVIDLCFPEDAARTRWVVVDWKSDSPPVGHPAREAYAKQLEWYAEAMLATVVPCQKVRTVLAGPFEELAPSRDEAAGDAKAEALRYADDAVRPLLVALLGAGAAVPTVGLELGEPVVGELTLAWAEAKLGLALDASPNEVESMRTLGWSVVTAEQSDAVALERALASLATALGVDVGDDDPHAAEEEGDR